MSRGPESLESVWHRTLTGDGRVSRRRLLGRAAGAALLASGMASALSACGIPGTAQRTREELEREAAAVHHPKTAIGAWTFSNWPLYMDRQVVRDFERRHGGKVRYVEEINENNDFFGKVRQPLAQGRAIGRDLVVLTDPMAGRWVRSGYAEPIDRRNVPNARRLTPALRDVGYDPGRQYSLPYQSGALGLGYDIRRTGRPLHSLKELFSPQWKGRVAMLADAQDAAGTVLLMQGKDASRATLDEQLGAIERIDEQNRRGQFRRFTGNDYTTDLTKGNVVIALAYSGDMVQLQSDNPDLRFVYPEEGSILFTDNLIEPAGVAHPYAAEAMMNHLYEPEVAARLCAYVNYISPVEGIREILERTDPSIAENPLIFPSADVRRRLHTYASLTTRELGTLDAAMAAVTGG